MSTDNSRPIRRTGRRGFLKGIGASALATSAVVFGTQRAAQAYTVGCCNLALPPSSWSTCNSKSDKWIWSCRHTAPHGTCYRYQCCEAGYTPWGTSTISAWRNAGIC
ncbi:MAG TPA: hypothetical protein VIL37_08235 [Natronosporangium sp.]